MSKGLAGVKTLTAKQIAEKWKLPLAIVAKKIAAGVKVEKEHTTSTSQANEIARDHLGERPDYYDKLHKMEKAPIVKEEIGTGGVRGLGFVTGDPGVNYVDQYINTNAMSYEDWNGNILKLIRDRHNKHLKDMGFSSFSPNDLQNASNKVVNESMLNELGEYDNKGGTTGAEGLTDAHPRIYRKNEMSENDLKGVCWKGYTAKGLKKKGNRMVPNCVSVKEQSPANVSYKERPMYEKSSNAYPTSTDRGIYEDQLDELSSKTLKSYGAKAYYSKSKAEMEKGKAFGPHARFVSGTKYDDIIKKRSKGIERSDKRLHELKDETLGSYIKKAAKSRREALNKDGAKADVKTWGKRQKGISTAIDKLTREFWTPFVTPHHKHSARLSKEKANKPDVIMDPGAGGTTKTIHEELKMDTKEIINEALDSILENNLPEMKDNLMLALQEKAMEKLEERKKEIAAQYFAQ